MSLYLFDNIKHFIENTYGLPYMNRNKTYNGRIHGSIMQSITSQLLIIPVLYMQLSFLINMGKDSKANY